MKNKIMNWKIKKAGIILIMLLALTGLTACNTKKIETVTQEPEQIQEEKPTQVPTMVPSENDQTADSDQGAADAEANQYKNLSQLSTLLGLPKEELIKKVNSDYTAVDEGGLEFTQPEIRVWFDVDGKTNQIFTVDTKIDIDGLKVGDDIKSFREKLGDPTKDNNGEAHFKYGDIFILVHYDTEAGKTYDLYLLKEDF
jgi:hypothetical protein